MGTSEQCQESYHNCFLTERADNKAQDKATETLVETLFLVALGIKIGSKQLSNSPENCPGGSSASSPCTCSVCLSFILPVQASASWPRPFHKHHLFLSASDLMPSSYPDRFPFLPNQQNPIRKARHSPHWFPGTASPMQTSKKTNSGSWRYPHTVGQNGHCCPVDLQYHPSSISAWLRYFIGDPQH